MHLSYSDFAYLKQVVYKRTTFHLRCVSKWMEKCVRLIQYVPIFLCSCLNVCLKQTVYYIVSEAWAVTFCLKNGQETGSVMKWVNSFSVSKAYYMQWDLQSIEILIKYWTNLSVLKSQRNHLPNPFKFKVIDIILFLWMLSFTQ